MGKTMVMAGIICMTVGIIIFLVYITVGKAFEKKLKEKLMKEY